MTGLVDKILALDAALTAGEIPHAFGGALALAYATEEPRGTRDIDVNVFVTSDRAEAVFRALPDAVRWTAADVRRVERDDQIRLLWGDSPVDLFFSAHRFHELAARRSRLVPLADAMIPVLDATDLAVFKTMSNRSRDWADLEAMRDVGSVDVDDAEGWLVRLLGDDDRVVRFRELFRG